MIPIKVDIGQSRIERNFQPETIDVFHHLSHVFERYFFRCCHASEPNREEVRDFCQLNDVCFTSQSNLFKLHCNNIIIIVPLVCSLVAINKNTAAAKRIVNTGKKRSRGKKHRGKTKALNALYTLIINVNILRNP